MLQTKLNMQLGFDQTQQTSCFITIMTAMTTLTQLAHMQRVLRNSCKESVVYIIFVITSFFLSIKQIFFSLKFIVEVLSFVTHNT